MTALAPTASMRRGWSVRLDAPALDSAIAAAVTISSRDAAQLGMVGKGNFNRDGRGSMRGTDV